uniref:Uncharacterized protein n=1 Tax=Anguilla anguilla TaxID=7936 RepID=A0A0E9V9J1_ANGAN
MLHEVIRAVKVNYRAEFHLTYTPRRS